MSYYMAGGDYYRMGDGFWSGVGKGIKSLAHFVKSPVGSMVTGLLPGSGLIHAAASTVDTSSPAASQSNATAGNADASQLAAPSLGPGVSLLPSHTQKSTALAIPGHPAALAVTGLGPMGMQRGTVFQDGKRFHYSKRTGLLVKGRTHRMNPLNPHALRRALSRAKSFARFASHVVSFTKHGAHGAKFKLHRKRRR